MRQVNRIACTVLVIALGASDSRAQDMTVDRVGWLQGCWQSTSPQATIEEQWMAPRGGSMLGMGRTVRGERTTEYELVLITAENGRLAYKAHPSGQSPATFVSTTASESAVVFENPAHDFPQTVGYRRQGHDRLQAWIEGRVKQQLRRVDFSYQRVQCDSLPGLP